MIEIKRILFTTDFSDYSKYALPYAVSMAQKYEAELHALYVVEPLNTPADFAWEVVSYEEIEEQHETHARESLKKMIEKEVPEDLNTRVAVERGQSVRHIISYAKEHAVDLLVMSTHGVTGLEHILFGSTTEKVVRKAPCPVLTVRHPDHNEE